MRETQRNYIKTSPPRPLSINGEGESEVFPLFVIQLPDHKEGSESEEFWEKNFDGEIPHSGQIFKLSAPVFATARAVWADSEILSVSLSVKSKICGECVRCLEKAELAISSELLYLYSSCKQESDDEMTVNVRAFGKTLDVSEQVWESIVLLLPSKLLCSEDCRGLCSSCGCKLD